MAAVIGQVLTPAAAHGLSTESREVHASRLLFTPEPRQASKVVQGINLMNY